jgi:acyl-CoA synthetase (AMP-forming)/AMP-acid ligase II
MSTVSATSTLRSSERSAAPAGPAYVHDIPAQLAVSAADRAVIGNASLRLTGRELQERIVAAAAELARSGIAAGERVAIVGENSLPLAIAYFAALRIGAWPILINARMTRAEIARIISHARPRLALFALPGSPAAEAHAANAATSPLGALPGAVAAPLIGGAAEPVSEDPARRVGALLYTSGTTGAPKGVMLSHASLLFVAREAARLRAMTAADRAYVVLPVSHVFGLTSAFLGTLCHASEVRLVPRFDAAAVLDSLARDGITVFQGVPAMFQRLLDAAVGAGRIAAPALRFLSAGGAALDPALAERIEARLGVPLNNGYGLTETSPTVASTRRMSTKDPREPAGSVGTPLPGVAIRIVDPETGAECPAGEVGEILVRSPGLMLGYYRAPEATAAAVADGWLRTGDLGRLTAEGRLLMAGRLKELIIRSGFNVYPAEVEGALAAHPDVAAVAVVGVPVDGNEEVVAFLEPRVGRRIDIAAVAAFAAERLAPYKRPTRLLVQAALPLTSTGKVRKSELASLAAAELVRATS